MSRTPPAVDRRAVFVFEHSCRANGHPTLALVV
jgi:hypothetical protein